MPLRFFNIDLHISVIEDVKNIWNNLFQNIEIIDWSISGHKHLFKHSIEDLNPIINQHNWRGFNINMINDFQNKYDSLLYQFDGFIVTHTPIFIMLFEKYHKPIIVINSCRFNQPFCWIDPYQLQNVFYDCIRRLDKNGLLIFIHNNQGDEMYFNKYLNNGDGTPGFQEVKSSYIPSLCEYINVKYQPTKNEILLDDKYNVSNIKHPQIVLKKYPYSWELILNYKAVIIIPREISYMTFFEYLQSNIPILIPSKEFLIQIYNQTKIIGTLTDYNLELKENIHDWIQYADYYHIDFQDKIIYFNNWEECINIINQKDFDDILKKKSIMMKNYNTNRKLNIYMKWNEQFHLHFFKFICYNFWPCLAKFHLDCKDYQENCRPFYKYNEIDVKKLQSNDIIFVKTDFLNVFVEQILPYIQTNFRIILAVSDLSPNSNHIESLINNIHCQKIISTNIIQTHPKIIPIPIGFQEPLRNHNYLEYNKILKHVSSEIVNKDIDLFVRHFSKTHPIRNINIFKHLGEHPFKNIIHTFEQIDCTPFLKRSKYAIVLRGNGLDTHYFYECILNKCVPIFINDFKYSLYNTFPCIQINIHKLNELKDFDMDTFYNNINWIESIEKLYREYYYKYINRH